MKLVINNYEVECFDDLLDYRSTLKEMNVTPVFSGELYDIGKKINNLVGLDVIVEIKKRIFHDVKFVIITKK
jgi:hypothetical protein